MFLITLIFMKLTGFRKAGLIHPEISVAIISLSGANLDQWSSLEDWTFLFSVSTTEANRENMLTTVRAVFN